MDEPDERPKKSKRALAEIALSLEAAHTTYAEIGRELGMSSGEAYAFCKATREELPKLTVEEERALDVALCNDLLKRVVAKAQRGDSDAIRNGVLLMQRRAKLMGLDAPAKHALTNAAGADVTSDEILLRLSRIAAAAGPGGDDPEPDSD